MSETPKRREQGNQPDQEDLRLKDASINSLEVEGYSSVSRSVHHSYCAI